MPRGIYERKPKEVIEEVKEPMFTKGEPEVKTKVEPEVATKERVRKYSDNKDHKGEGEPLCFNCSHRSDMHYVEQRWTEQKFGNNLQGDFVQVEIQKRKPVYDGGRPCQHACLCKQYE